MPWLSLKKRSLSRVPPDEGGYYGQVWDYHYDGLVDIALGQGDADMAEESLRRWSRHEDQMPANRFIRRARCLADVYLHRQQLGEALRWAETAFEAALDTDYAEVRMASFRSYVGSGRRWAIFEAAHVGWFTTPNTLEGRASSISMNFIACSAGLPCSRASQAGRCSWRTQRSAWQSGAGFRQGTATRKPHRFEARVRRIRRGRRRRQGVAAL